MKYIIILLALISLALPQDTLKLKQSNVIYSGELMEISGDFVKFKSEGALFGNMIKLDKIDYLISNGSMIVENGNILNVKINQSPVMNDAPGNDDDIDYMYVGMGYTLPLGNGSYGLSLTTINIANKFGLYFSAYGPGNLKSIKGYDSPFPGDELIDFSSDYSWGAMSFGLTYYFNEFAIFGGYCNGQKWILDSYMYYDEFHILDPTGYYYVEYSYTENTPGIELGIHYFLTDYWGEGYPLFITAGYNTSMEILLLGVVLGFGVPVIR